MTVRFQPSQSLERRQTLVSQIYDTALDENLWPDVLAQFAKALNSDQGIIRVMSANFDDVERVYSHNRDPDWNRPYNSYYKNVDPFLKMVSPQHDLLACTHQIFSDREYKKYEFHADFISPQDIHYGMGGFLHNSDTSKTYISFHRSSRQRGFEHEAFEFFKAMMSHIKKCIVINERTRAIDFENYLLRDSLNYCNSPLLLAKQDGEVLFMNTQAEALIKQQSNISIKRGFISIQPVGADRELKQLMQQASPDLSVTGLVQGGGMCITESNKQIALSIMVTPLNPERMNNDIGGSDCVLLLFSTNSLQVSISAEMLISLYSFTPAEARLVEQLCRGLTLDQIAHQFKLSKNTLRTQLRSSFRKTGAVRQVDLINLVNNGPLGAIRTS